MHTELNVVYAVFFTKSHVNAVVISTLEIIIIKTEKEWSKTKKL